MKKKYSLCFVFSILFTTTFAQQDPKKTHFMFDRQSFNPAFSGSNPHNFCITSLYHQQWLNFRDNDNNIRTGPGTQLISVNGRVPYSGNGLGLTIANDALGYERTVDFQFSYAHHFRLGATGSLGVGAGAGVIQKNLDGTKYRPIDPNDPLIPVKAVSDRKPDLSAGLYYRNPDFYGLYAGLSATHLIQSKLTYPTRSGAYTDYALTTTGYFTAGASFPAAGGLIDIEPSVLIKSDITKTQYDFNLAMWYNRSLRFAIGSSFNQGTFVTAMIGYKFSRALFISYSWDVVTTEIYNISPSTHELLINYCFFFKELPPFLTPRFLGGSHITY